MAYVGVNVLAIAAMLAAPTGRADIDMTKARLR